MTSSVPLSLNGCVLVVTWLALAGSLEWVCPCGHMIPLGWASLEWVCACPMHVPGLNTKAKFRNSTLLDKMANLRDSTDLTGLAESALAHFKVSQS